jgi:hypothetical protein
MAEQAALEPTVGPLHSHNSNSSYRSDGVQEMFTTVKRKFDYVTLNELLQLLFIVVLRPQELCKLH